MLFFVCPANSPRLRIKANINSNAADLLDNVNKVLFGSVYDKWEGTSGLANEPKTKPYNRRRTPKLWIEKENINFCSDFLIFELIVFGAVGAHRVFRSLRSSTSHLPPYPIWLTCDDKCHFES